MMQSHTFARVAPVAVACVITLMSPIRAHAQDRTPRPGRADDTVIRLEIPIQTIAADVLRDVSRLVDIATSEEISREIRNALREATAAIAQYTRVDPRGGLSRGGLGAVDIDVWDEAQDREFRFEQVDRATKTLALGQTGQLELRNIVGDITVTAGSGRDVSVEIVRRSRGRTEADAKTGLERVTANVEQRGERATVQTDYPNERRLPYNVSVSYIVTAPAGTRVTAGSVSGDLLFKNIKGDISATVTSGDITISGGGQVSEARTISGDVSLTDVSGDSSLRVGTVSGDVTLQRLKARRVEVDVTSGDVIAREMTVDAADLKSLSGSVEYAGTFARGGRYGFQSHSGDIHLIVAGNTGFELQATTFNGAIRPENGVEVKGAASSRRSLRGTVGDGGATVTATTFSGNVTIGRR